MADRHGGPKQCRHSPALPDRVSGCSSGLDCFACPLVLRPPKASDTPILSNEAADATAWNCVRVTHIPSDRVPGLGTQQHHPSVPPPQKPETQAEGNRFELGDTNAHSLGSRLGLGLGSTTMREHHPTNAEPHAAQTPTAFQQHPLITSPALKPQPCRRRSDSRLPPGLLPPA